MTLCFAGLGTALPPHAVSQPNAADIALPLSCDNAEHKRLLPALYRRTGVGRRHSVLLEPEAPDRARQSFFPDRDHTDDRGPGTRARMERYACEAAPLGQAAAMAALGEADCAPAKITHLVTVSCSGFSAPGWDLQLFDRLGLNRDVARTHVGFMGCHGALNGLRAAHAYVAADPKAVVLLVAVELCSLHYGYGWNPERIVSNALFADGAAAIVAHAGQTDREAASGSWRLRASGSHVVPQTADAMTWTIGDHGFEMTLSPRVPHLLAEHLQPWLVSWLGKHDLTLGQIRSWAVHPGGPRIVAATAEALELPGAIFDVSRQVLAEFGNMSSPTVLFLLDRLRQQRAESPCVALGFGPGLTIEAALLD